MIGYYVHHHGSGHRTRAESIAAHLHGPVTALSSAPLSTSGHFDGVVQLPSDDRATSPTNPTAGGALHWVPQHDDGLRDRMVVIASWIAIAKPSVIVVDVSVEVALLARLLGIPVVVVALPGTRVDAAHQLCFTIADRIIAAWPQSVYDPAWLQPFHTKTSYVGGISRFERRTPPVRNRRARPRILAMGGSGGSSTTADDVMACALVHPEYDWRAVGFGPDTWVDDPWQNLCDADVVIAHAGQGALADIACADRPAIVIPQARPFGEQRASAEAVAQAGLALTLPRWPPTESWPWLIRRALAPRTGRWEQWQTAGAAERAARAIESVTEFGAVRA